MKCMIRGLVLSALVLVGIAGAFAQQDTTVDWKLALQDLGTRLGALSSQAPADLDVWRSDAENLRGQLAAFAAVHPEMGLSVPDALPANAPIDQFQGQLDKLSAVVNSAIDQTPGSAFHLGTQTVTVTAPGEAPIPVAGSIDQTQIEQHDFLNVAKAMDYLPGVSIYHIAANRNEADMLVRGFSTRGQVPFYIDDIPVSVPYDGYVDFNRFVTSDIADVQVSRGYASPLEGPNALGGAINLVTVEPVKKIEGEALIGTGSGDTLLSSVRLGTRMRRFFVQGSFDWLQSTFIPLSGDFVVHQYAGLPDIIMTDRLNNSNSQDARYAGRVGWTPRNQDEYVFSYINQKGQKGAPLYQGPDTAATFRNFWTWPFWNFYSYQLHSNTGIGENSNIQVRAFYNEFQNGINMFTNDKYNALTDESIYHDHTDGTSAVFNTRLVKRNEISGSFFLKNDTHTEFEIVTKTNTTPAYTEPTLKDNDIQTSIGLQDAITITSKLHATAGFSADHFDGREGQSYTSTGAPPGIVPFTCISNPTNKLFTGCTLHAWNINPQVAASYGAWKGGSLFVTFADRGRFPMLKDVYSAGLGSGLPNPDLKPENSLNWNFGVSQSFGSRTLAQLDFFHSDVHNAIESVYVTDPGNPKAVNPEPAAALCPNAKINGFCSEMLNIGREMHEGVEFQVRSTITSRISGDLSYSYLDRSINYDFTNAPNVSQVNTSIVILPTVPRNKAVLTGDFRLPRNIVAIVSARFEGGLVLQDTTYNAKSPFFLPFSEAFGTVDIGTIVPVYKRATVQAGIKNLLDRNYYYTAGYPEEGRNWFVNLRYQF